MKYPYIKYMQALLLKGHKTSTVSDRLRALKINPPDDFDIDSVREDLFSIFSDEEMLHLQPGPHYSFETFISECKDKVASIGIDELIPVLTGNRNPFWEDAILIMTDPDIRIIVMALSILGKPSSEILQKVEEQTNIHLPPESLVYFMKYFWNITNMTKLELYHFISTGLSLKHRDLLIDAFHKKEAGLKWRVSGESVLTLEDILKSVMNESFIKFKSCVASDDVDNVSRTQQWASLSIKAAEKLKVIASESAPEVAADLEFKLKKITQDDIVTEDNIEGDVE